MEESRLFIATACDFDGGAARSAGLCKRSSASGTSGTSSVSFGKSLYPSRNQLAQWQAPLPMHNRGLLAQGRENGRQPSNITRPNEVRDIYKFSNNA